MEQHIEVTKTARYYTLGNLTPKTKEIWFVLHGYAQLAKNILQKFESVTTNSNYIIAPEGLNKFYAKGFSENPVANWMTNEDRENEIKDYCNYLNKLYTHLQINNDIKVNVIGFSQGVSTATRWIESNSFRFDKLILIAGEIAKEFQTKLPSKLSNLETIFLYGNKDPFIDKRKIDNLSTLYKSSLMKIIEFDGGHEINKEVIIGIMGKLRCLSCGSSVDNGKCKYCNSSSIDSVTNLEKKIPKNIFNEIKDHITNGRTLLAIKLYKETMHVGLMFAQEAIEEMKQNILK